MKAEIVIIVAVLAAVATFVKVVYEVGKSETHYRTCDRGQRGRR